MSSIVPMGGATSRYQEPCAPVEGAAASWYVLETKRHRETVAQAFLAQRGITSYLPRIAQWPRPAIGGEIVPMFPGYLFVHTFLPDEHYRVVWTPGVKAFLTAGGAPVPVAESIIDFLRDREGLDGVIRCGTGVTDASEVRIVNGPFRGLTAVVEQRLPARERVRVLMHMLQRETRVELPEKWVRLA
jgi:transcriptional antiterminator RfaH